MRCPLALVPLFIVIFCFLSFPLVGQYREYYIYGRVIDTEKKPIVGVTIYLRDETTSRSYTTKTDRKGEFRLVGLPHGIYRVILTKEGYRPVEDKWDFQTPQDRMQKVEIPTIILATTEQIEKLEIAREARAEFDEAMEKIRRSDFDAAVAILGKMIARNPDDANAHYLRGMVFFRKKMLAEAAAEFTRTIELAPSFAGSYHQLGLIHQQQGEQEEALGYYQKAAELDPQNADSLYNAGLILFGMTRVPEALEAFDKALAIRPDDPELLEMAGRCYIHQADFIKALELLEKARKLSTDPDKIKFLDQLIAKVKEQIKSCGQQTGFFLDKIYR